MLHPDTAETGGMAPAGAERRPADFSAAPSAGQREARYGREDRTNAGLTEQQQAVARENGDRHARAMRLDAIRRRHAAAHGGLAMAVEGREYQLHGREPVSGEDGVLVRYEPHADPALVEFHAGAHEDVAFLLDILHQAFARIRDLTSEGKEPAEGARPNGRPSPCEAPAQASGEAATGRERQTDRKDYAAEASIKLTQPAFVAYLVAHHGLEHDAPHEFAAGALRNALGIASRRDLNTDPTAAARWRDMKADFDAWRTHG